MKYFKLSFGEYKNWSEVDAAWKDEKRKYYKPPYQAAMNTDLRTFMIPDYGDDPYFPRGSNPTLKEVREYAKSVMESIVEKGLDLDEFTIEISAAVYYRDRGFEAYEPGGDHACLDTITCKFKR
jgi:hypothetical protein